jgi:beta-lactamase class A
MKIWRLLFIGALVGFAPAVNACQCLEGRAPCETYFQTPVVFTGEVVSIEKLPPLPPSKIMVVGLDTVVVRFAVSEAFRGVSGAEVSVQTGGLCSYFSFEMGRKYIVYGDRNDGSGPIHVEMCSRTAPLEKAQADIDFIHGLNAGPVGGDIRGSLQPQDARPHVVKGLVANQSVSIVGDNGERVTATTDENGNFKVAGLAPGKYTVTAPMLRGHTEVSPWHGTVFNGSCGVANFYSQWDGRIRGHVRDFLLQPMPNIIVTLEDPSLQLYQYSTETDENGAYEIRGVRPGQYIIAADDQGRLKQKPNSLVYYPSATFAMDAMTVNVGEATVEIGVDVTMPTPVEHALVEKWRSIAAEARGHVGVAAMIVESEEIAELNSTAHFPMQSVYKLPISMTVLQLVDAGKLSLEKSVEVRAADFIPAEKHSPLRDQNPGGTRKTIGELIRYALVESDGTASDILLREAGGAPAVRNYLRGFGVSDLIVKHTEMEMTWKTQYEDWCTPRAAVQVLLMLQRGQGISVASRELILNYMEESETGAARIRNLLPKGAMVADKTGASGMQNGLAAATNDIGLVTLPDGRHMAIAIFVSDSEAADAVRDSVIAKIARASWDAWVK